VIEPAGRRVGASNARVSIRVEREKIDSELYIVDIGITVKPVAVPDVALDVPGGTETVEVQKLPWYTKKEKEKLGVAAFFVEVMVLIVVILPTVLIKSGAPHGQGSSSGLHMEGCQFLGPEGFPRDQCSSMKKDV
jgi:hypothetical protein